MGPALTQNSNIYFGVNILLSKIWRCLQRGAWGRNNGGREKRTGGGRGRGGEGGDVAGHRLRGRRSSSPVYRSPGLAEGGLDVWSKGPHSLKSSAEGWAKGREAGAGAGATGGVSLPPDGPLAPLAALRLLLLTGQLRGTPMGGARWSSTLRSTTGGGGQKPPTQPSPHSERINVKKGSYV